MPENDFKKYYERELHDTLRQFDKRKNVLHWLALANVVLLASFLASIYVILDWQNSEPTWWLAASLPFVVLLIYTSYRRRYTKKELRKEYKTQIVNKIVQYIDPSLDYRYDYRVSTEDFKQSGIYKRKPDRMSGEDLITGVLDKTEISFSELLAEYKTVTTDGNGHTKEKWKTIFRGVFLIADFHKNFKTETYVLPDRWERVFGNFARRFQKIGGSGGRGQLAEMENTAFEKEFRVYSHDQIEARYILTPAMMERILDFKNKTGFKTAFSFVNSKMFVAIPLRKNLFEPRWYGRNASLKYTMQSFNYLLKFTSIVEDLNLNTRIWSKQ
jgi:hypothetical protein